MTTTLIHAITALWLGTASLEQEAPKHAVMSVYELIEEVYEPMEMTIEDIFYIEGEKAGLTLKQTRRFYEIANCESRLNPRAVSSTGDFGILQLNDYYWDFDHDKVFDPQYNAWYAMNVIYPRQGFNAWVCNRLID